MRLLGLALLLSLSGCGVTQVMDHADDGTPILIRSPQPDADDLEDLHADHGVRTVLNLRGEKPGRSWYDEEQEGVRRIGATPVVIDISGSRAPTPDQVQAFFDLVEDRERWPILMHCQGGIHRTGVLAGLYRIQSQGWDGERAVEEMEDLWFDWTVEDRDDLKRFLRTYQPDPSRQIPREPAPETP